MCAKLGNAYRDLTVELTLVLVQFEDASMETSPLAGGEPPLPTRRHRPRVYLAALVVACVAAGGLSHGARGNAGNDKRSQIDAWPVSSRGQRRFAS